MTRHAMILFTTLTALLLACDDESTTGLPPVDRIEIESGDGQTAVAGEPLPEPVIARVLREDGSEAFAVLKMQLVDGGSLSIDGARASGVGAIVESTTSGQASVVWTLADQPGTQQLRFFTVPSPGDTIETFATAEATAPAS